MSTVTVHTKSNCQQCVATKRKLGKLGIPYVEVELTEESAAKFKRVGHLSAPVVTHGELSWSGYQPEKLNELAKAMNSKETPDDPPTD